jgi:site-specific recombinase XerD
MDIEEYLNTLRLAKLSPKTVEAYARELDRFRQFARTRHLRITQIKPSIVMQYLDEMNGRHPSNGEAVRRRLTALSTFFTFLELSSDDRIRNPSPRCAGHVGRRPRPSRSMMKSWKPCWLALLSNGTRPS